MKEFPRRAISERERAVLDLLLAADFPGVEDLRRQAATVVAMDGCACGCPSVNFVHPAAPPGIQAVVDAGVRGSNDSIFVFTAGEYLGGIEYVPIDEPTATELPDPDLIEVWPP